MNCPQCRKKMVYMREFQGPYKTFWYCITCAMVVGVKKGIPEHRLKRVIRAYWGVSLYKGETVAK